MTRTSRCAFLWPRACWWSCPCECPMEDSDKEGYVSRMRTLLLDHGRRCIYREIYHLCPASVEFGLFRPFLMFLFGGYCSHSSRHIFPLKAAHPNSINLFSFPSWELPFILSHIPHHNFRRPDTIPQTPTPLEVSTNATQLTTTSWLVRKLPGG